MKLQKSAIPSSNCLFPGISIVILRAMCPGKPLRYFLLLSSRERRKTAIPSLWWGPISLLASSLQAAGECVRMGSSARFCLLLPSCMFPRSHRKTGSPLEMSSPSRAPGQSIRCLTPPTKARSEAPVQALPTRHFTESIKRSHGLPSALNKTFITNARRYLTISEDKHKQKYHITQFFPSWTGGLCISSLLPFSK